MKYSLHLGLNEVSPKYYNGWDGKLHGAVKDSLEIQKICVQNGFIARRFINKQVTLSNVEKEIKRVSYIARPGDTFILSYSGHGGNYWDYSKDETDGFDETFCFFDGQVLDDVIYTMLSYFNEGVDVIVISDSCHSATNVRDVMNPKYIRKSMPDVKANTFHVDNLVYKTERLKPNILGFSACLDSEYAYDTSTGGVFTKAIKKAFKKNMSWETLHTQVKALSYTKDTPQTSVLTEYDGKIKDKPSF